MDLKSALLMDLSIFNSWESGGYLVMRVNRRSGRSPLPSGGSCPIRSIWWYPLVGVGGGWSRSICGWTLCVLCPRILEDNIY